MRARHLGDWVCLADHTEVFDLSDEIFGISFDSVSVISEFTDPGNLSSESYLTTRKSVE